MPKRATKRLMMDKKILEHFNIIIIADIINTECYFIMSEIW